MLKVQVMREKKKRKQFHVIKEFSSSDCTFTMYDLVIESISIHSKHDCSSTLDAAEKKIVDYISVPLQLPSL